MAFLDILLGLVIGLMTTVLVYFIMKLKLRHRIAMVEAEFRQLWAEQEARIRRDATNRSRYVLKGKIAEHMVPLLKDVFRYEPADARFIGAPVDYVIFEGYSSVKDGLADRPITIVFADVKTGSAGLTRPEQRIKEAVENGRIRWETIRLDF